MEDQPRGEDGGASHRAPREGPVVGRQEGVAEPGATGVVGEALAVRKPGRGHTHPLGLVARARRARRREERGVRLDEDAIERRQRCDLGRGLLTAPEDETREAQDRTELQHGLRVVDGARE